jgi:hypothetical protein
MITRFSLIAVCALLAFACKTENKMMEAGDTTATSTDTTRTTSSEEGWTSLLQGNTLNGWRNFKSQEAGQAWSVQDGVLMFDPKSGKPGGDLMTDKEFENFELELDWKIDSCGNSGIIFNVVEDEKYDAVWHTGPEMQVLDNACHPDAKIIKHRAGDLYDLISSSTEVAKPAGEWNQVRIISNNANYEFYLNGTKIVSFTMHTPEWDRLVAGSKFKDMPAFGKATKGHIALQDHGDRVWFRNIRIKEL